MSDTKTTITYRTGNDIAPELVADLYRAAGLPRPVDDLERLGLMIQNANLVVSAWDGDRLVGIARSLSDYSFVTYLSDLAVDPGYQKHGIGRALIALVKEHGGGEQASIILLSLPDAMTYYPHIGMEAMDNCFGLKRSQ